jgi:hypothetical protein
MGCGDLYQNQFAVPNQQYQNQFAQNGHGNERAQNLHMESFQAQAAGPVLPARRSLDDQALLHQEVSQMLRKVYSLQSLVFAREFCIKMFLSQMLRIALSPLLSLSPLVPYVWVAIAIFLRGLFFVVLD